MKRITPILLLLLLLCGCGGERGIERGLELRSRIQSGESCGFVCGITVDYGEKLYSFRMECGFDRQGNMTFRVLEPETVAGISGTVSASGGKLEFEDTALAFELLAEEQASPISAPWVMMNALRGGYLRSCWEEDGVFCMTLDETYEEHAFQVDLRLDGGDQPSHAEILWEGRKILTLDIEDFALEAGN